MSRNPKEAPDIHEEEDVLLLLRAHDARAAERLVAVFGDRVYGLSLRILANEEDAKECVQETFLTIWRKWDTFREQSKFSSWIYRVAANHAFMKLRKRRRHQVEVSLDQLTDHGATPLENLSGDEVEAGLLASRTQSPAAEMEREELAQTIQRAIAALSPTYRTAYVLKDIDGLSLKEIADIMGLSEAAVKSRVHRARLELRRRLEGYL